MISVVILFVFVFIGVGLREGKVERFRLTVGLSMCIVVQLN